MILFIVFCNWYKIQKIGSDSSYQIETKNSKSVTDAKIPF